MAKKFEIKVRSFVHKGDELVSVDALSPQDQVELATQLKINWLNSLYRGQATFEQCNPLP